MVSTAETRIDSADLRLVGRTYAIPFVRVWKACLDLVRGDLPGWYARWWDEELAVIQALARVAPFRRVSDIAICVRLDEQGQTRVDLRSSGRFTVVGDFGSNTRLIGEFCAALDRKLTEPPPPPALRSNQADEPEDDDETGGPISARTGSPSSGETGEPDPAETASSGSASPDSSSGG